MKSLKARSNPLSQSSNQLEALRGTDSLKKLPTFNEKLSEIGLSPLRPTGVEIFQINVGKMCNQTCKHCHVDAGPDRKEIMTRETMAQCLEALKKSSAKTVDLTGGAPEMNPNFRWFVEEIRKLDKEIIVRCNLTIILANKAYSDLPEFFAKNKIRVVSSLPFYEKAKTDRQRGDGVFESSIKALQMLNSVGYGKQGSGLSLDLVYNPVGAFLSGPQESLEVEFKKRLKKDFDIEFNSLLTITNMPISRFLEFLIESGNLEAYMEKLVTAFNPQAAKGVMCRNTISVGWNGDLFDCDFNQMLDMKVPGHVSDYSENKLVDRNIQIDQHCFGCTAGLGSSCGGATV